MAVSEIIRFVLPAHRRADFATLRASIARHGAVKSQYFGPSIATGGASLPVRGQEMCWVIQWPLDTKLPSSSLQSQLNELAEDNGATSLRFELAEKQGTHIEQALAAPICQFATINLTANAPKTDAAFRHSMHKTYTDCFLTKGFVGGDWAYAINSNDTGGELVADATEEAAISEADRNLAVYCLGWESVEAHQAYHRTALFAEEIDNLAPWFGPGTGAWYAKFEKHVDL